MVNSPSGDFKLFEVIVQTTIGREVVPCGENITLDCEVGSIHYQNVYWKPYSCKGVFQTDSHFTNHFYHNPILQYSPLQMRDKIDYKYIK